MARLQIDGMPADLGAVGVAADGVPQAETETKQEYFLKYYNYSNFSFTCWLLVLWTKTACTHKNKNKNPKHQTTIMQASSLANASAGAIADHGVQVDP